jgi:hypothetical protein
MEHYAFISYSSVDSNVTYKIVNALEKSGITCWIAPRDIPFGSTYAASIIQAIKISTFFIFIYSNASNESDAVINEIEKASTLKSITIIPFKIENLPYSDSLEYYLRSKQNIIAYGRPIEEATNELAKHIKSRLATLAETNDKQQSQELLNTTQLDEGHKKKANKKVGLFFLGGIIAFTIFYIGIKFSFYSPIDSRPFEKQEAFDSAKKIPDNSEVVPLDQPEKKQINEAGKINVTVSNPYTINAGEEAQINILAFTDQNSPIADGTVKISFGGGWFNNSGTSTEIGKTDKNGGFSTKWRSPKPAASAYVGSLDISKEGMIEYSTEITIKIVN